MRREGDTNVWRMEARNMAYSNYSYNHENDVRANFFQLGNFLPFSGSIIISLSDSEANVWKLKAFI